MIDDEHDIGRGETEGEDERSLFDDVEAIIEDGRTYLEAEMAYQRTRAAFAADRAKDAAMFAALGGTMAMLALVALTVGLVIALVPYLTAWGSAASVTIVWLIAAAVFMRIASGKWRRLLSTFLERERSE